MYKVKTLDKIAQDGLDVLLREHYEVGPDVKNPDAVILRSHNMHGMDLADSMLAVGRAGAGVNNIPIEQCSEKGIVVFNTPGANANAVKELVITGLLLASRDIAEGIEFARSLKGKGADVPGIIEKNKKKYAGQEIIGKTLGVVGLGKVGVMVANSAVDMGMEVVGYDPFISVESAWGLSRDVQRAEGFNALIADADYISLHAPLNDKTRGMINAGIFKGMKKGVRILNFSRADIVNNNDLKEAIQNGTVRRYVTDFPDEDVLNMNNVIPIPHLGASTCEAENNCAMMIARQIRSFVEHGKIKNSVNYPNCKLDQNSDYRLIVMNKNIPNMVGQISSILAKSNINIVEMLNKSKGDNACTIIDVSEKPTGEIVQTLSDIEGVVKVRSLSL